MKIKELAKSTLSRILRYTGIFLLIYISMVFYLALTERRNAFPRAITHNEARTAIADKAKNINCTLDDGTVLEGFVIGNEQNNVLLYYPDADEDAAQFLAELDSLPGYAAATFNYRGSGNNKGTPSQETFEPDAQMIYECASQINGNAPKIVVGRGTGDPAYRRMYIRAQAGMRRHHTQQRGSRILGIQPRPPQKSAFRSCRSVRCTGRRWKGQQGVYLYLQKMLAP